ncbi:gluconate 2-dehydrogenase subunit 3 family protein [Panacibacter ginsenosidivorans]|nr:gluconate 2-dehydrogenase subunit 3 family protein [Panacibacter ginsenosidivorans]
MNRRTAFKQLLFVSAGAALIPACMQDKNKASVILKNFSITAGQEQLLAELAETIIPKTDTPGAKDISAHLFALKMIDDCSSKEDQDKFLKGLTAFESYSNKQLGKSFTAATATERGKVLTELETQKDKDQKDDAAQFYGTVKKLTVHAYTSSQFYLTKVQVYELVPGRYHGCVPVKAGA